MQPESMSSSDETQAGEVDSSVGSSYAERRKSSKPIMEKRRRARINSSLNQLKTILLEALKKDSTRHSKLEKADILEMTVKYLKNVERQRLSVSLSIDPSVVDKYRAGFNECRNEVMKFLSTCEGVTVDVRTRLLSHLATCLQSMHTQSSLFDDPGLTIESPSFSSPLLRNGQNQPIQIRFPEVQTKVAGNATSYTTNIAPKPTPCPTTVFDSQLAVVHTSQGHQSAPIVLPEGTQLASTIRGLPSGNFAVFLPQISGSSTTYLAPISAQTLQCQPTSQPVNVVPCVPRPIPLQAKSKTRKTDANLPAAESISVQQHEQYASSEAGSYLADSPPEKVRTQASNSPETHQGRIRSHGKPFYRKRARSPTKERDRYVQERPPVSTSHVSPESFESNTPPSKKRLECKRKRRRNTRHKPEYIQLEKAKVYESRDASSDNLSSSLFYPPPHQPHSPQRSPTSTTSHDVDDTCSDSSLGIPQRPGHLPLGNRTSGPWRPWSKPNIFGKDT